jgi:hypothetical protein
MPPHFSWGRRQFRFADTRRRIGSRRPAVEALEDRCLLTTYTVTTVNDLLHDTTPGDVTLRDVLTAIDTQASSGNAAAGTASNLVRFAIGTPGSVQTLNLTSALPALLHPAFLDGWSQGGAGYNGPPLIALNGSAAGAGANGLELDAGSEGSEVRGLVVQQFSNNGIEVKGASGTLIMGNYLGTDAAGTAVLGNASDGLLLDAGARANTVGGRGAGAGNVIAGNGNGIEIAGAGTSGNVVLGNLIGTDRTATVAMGNVSDGILIDGGATANTVGGTAAGSANVVSGAVAVVPTQGGNSSQPGAVFSLGAPTIAGNVASFDVYVNYTDTPPAEMVYVGVDVRGDAGVLAPTDPNTGQPDFSAFRFTPSSTLGSGWAPVDNAFPGEFLFHTPPPPGTQPPSGLVPNATYLVGTLTYDLSRFGITPGPSLSLSIAGSDTVIGTEQNGQPSTFTFVDASFLPGQQPIQPAPATAGVDVTGAGTGGNVVLGNLVGTNPSGTAELGHLTDGVLVQDGAANNTVGGTSAGAGNVVGGNDDGVVLSGGGTSGNVVAGNLIGTGRGGTADLGNTLAGVLVQGGAAGNAIGGMAPGAGNTIAFNGAGVVAGSSAADTATINDSVLSNRIYGGTGPGIDLGNQGVTATGPLPANFPNEGQAAPVITGLTLQSVSARLTSVPNTTFRIEFYATPPAGRAPTFLSARNVTTGATGAATFTTPVAGLPVGTAVTATATNLTTGDTSDFSPPGTQMLILSGPVTASAGAPQGVTVSIQVFFGNTPLASRTVTLTVPGLPGRVTATTNAAGVATLRWVAPSGTPPGSYAFVATLSGGEGVPGDVAEGTLIVTPGPGGRGRRWVR